jgi:hypothetical protein
MDDWGEPSRIRDMQRKGQIGEFVPFLDKKIRLPREFPPGSTAGEDGVARAARSACQGRSNRMLM